MAAARKDGGGTELSGRAEKTEEAFLQASATLRSARNAVGKLAGNVDGALSRWVTSREEGERAGLLGSDAVKAVAALEKDLKPARDKAVADRAAHEAASAKLRAARAAVERLSAEGRIDQARKRIEGLLAESCPPRGSRHGGARAAAEKLAAELAEVQKVAGSSTQAAEKAPGIFPERGPAPRRHSPTSRPRCRSSPRWRRSRRGRSASRPRDRGCQAEVRGGRSGAPRIRRPVARGP